MKVNQYALSAGLVSMMSLPTVLAGTYVSEGVYGNPFAAISGAAATSVWSDVSESVHTGFPGWPGSSSWGATIAPNSSSGTTTDIELERVSGASHWLGGGPYPSDDTIYFGGMSFSYDDGGTLKASEIDPVADLSEVVFQVQLGEANDDDFTPTEVPVLTYTTTSGTYTATVNGGGGQVDSFVNGTYQNGEYDVDETVVLNEHKYVWDLSGVTEDILEFEIEWRQVMHSQLYGFQVDQKD